MSGNPEIVLFFGTDYYALQGGSSFGVFKLNA